MSIFSDVQHSNSEYNDRVDLESLPSVRITIANVEKIVKESKHIS